MTLATTFEQRETADIETSSDDYASRFSGEIGKWFLSIQEDGVLRMLAPYAGAKVLDVGGGHGQLTGAIIEHGYDLTVMGSAPSCVRRIAPFVRTGRCHFDTGNFLGLPYADAEFDVVVSVRLLPHVNHWKPFLTELARVAKHAVVFDYPEVRSVNYIAPLLFHWKKQMEGNTRTYRCFREPELLSHLASHGLEFADRYQQFLMPMVLHRKLNALRFSAITEAIGRSLGLTNQFGSPVILKVRRKDGPSL